MSKKKIFLTLVLSILFAVSFGHEIENENEIESEIKFCTSRDQNDCTPQVFQPTNEWQTVKKGQHVPPGLHVRMNFETGEVEAKLMDKPSESKEIIVIDDQQQQENENKLKVGEEDNQAEKEVNDFKSELSIVPVNEEEGKEEYKPTVLTKERLKELEEIWDYLTEMVNKEITEMFKSLEVIKNNPDDEEKVVESLKLIESVVHQYDYAKDFKAVGGFQLMWDIAISTNDTQVKSGCLSVLGSASQSNPELQIHCIDEMNLLEGIQSQLNIEYNPEVRRKLLFVLSTIARGTRRGREVFMNLKFFDFLSEQYKKEQDEKFKKKCLTIITDFMNEMSDFGTNSVQLPSLEETWCKFFMEQLTLDNMDSIEKGLEAISISIHNSLCHYEKEKLLQSLDLASNFINSQEGLDPEYLEILNQKVSLIQSLI